MAEIEEKKKNKNRRTTFLVFPSMQLRIVSKLVGIMIILTVVFGVFTYLSVSEKAPVFLDEAMTQAYQSQLRMLIISLTATVVMGCAAVYLFGIYVTHKIVGPLIPIGNLIEELSKGNYEAKDVKLRKGDELQDFADKVNQLKAILKEKNS